MLLKVSGFLGVLHYLYIEAERQGCDSGHALAPDLSIMTMIYTLKCPAACADHCGGELRRQGRAGGHTGGHPGGH